MKTLTYDVQIDEIMSQFDFARVHKVMCLTTWEWHDKKTNKMTIPSISKLKIVARAMLTDLTETENEKITGIQSGGFHADKVNGLLSLKFIISEANGVLEEHSL